MVRAHGAFHTCTVFAERAPRRRRQQRFQLRQKHRLPVPPVAPGFIVDLLHFRPIAPCHWHRNQAGSPRHSSTLRTTNQSLLTTLLKHQRRKDEHEVMKPAFGAFDSLHKLKVVKRILQ